MTGLGEKIVELRKQKGITQEQLAEELEVTRQTISKWELNQSSPDLNYIRKISDYFNVTTDYLIKEKTSNEIHKDNHKATEQVVHTISSKLIVGIIAVVSGIALLLVGIVMSEDNGEWFLAIITGALMIIVGLEIILIKKNMGLKVMWTLWSCIAVPMMIGYASALAIGNSSLLSINTLRGIMYWFVIISFIVLLIASIKSRKKSIELHR